MSDQFSRDFPPILFFGELKPHAKFQNHTITPSRRKVTQAERKKQRETGGAISLGTVHLNLYVDILRQNYVLKIFHLHIQFQQAINQYSPLLLYLHKTADHICCMQIAFCNSNVFIFLAVNEINFLLDAVRNINEALWQRFCVLTLFQYSGWTTPKIYLMQMRLFISGLTFFIEIFEIKDSKVNYLNWQKQQRSIMDPGVSRSVSVGTNRHSNNFLFSQLFTQSEPEQ